MTHTCSFHSSCSYGKCFLNYQCQENDFSIILYNTIYESIITSDNKKSTYNIYCSYGDQYLKCNNMTKMDFNGFQFDNPQCFLFSMTTVNDAGFSCLYLSGSDAVIKPREIEMANFKSNGFETLSAIRFASQCKYTFTAKKCVLLSNRPLFEQESVDNPLVQVFCYNCILTQTYGKNVIVDSSNENANGVATNVFKLIPHFTYVDFCPGDKTL